MSDSSLSAVEQAEEIFKDYQENREEYLRETLRDEEFRPNEYTDSTLSKTIENFLQGKVTGIEDEAIKNLFDLRLQVIKKITEDKKALKLTPSKTSGDNQEVIYKRVVDLGGSSLEIWFDVKNPQEGELQIYNQIPMDTESGEEQDFTSDVILLTEDTFILHSYNLGPRGEPEPNGFTQISFSNPKKNTVNDKTPAAIKLAANMMSTYLQTP